MTAIDERLSEIISKALQIDEDRLTENINCSRVQRENHSPNISMQRLAYNQNSSLCPSSNIKREDFR